MRVAFFSPMPPSRSGIADYSAALVAALDKLAAVTVFHEKPAAFDPNAFDACLYQIGNNASHDFVYEQALAVPGVLVLHEANLHHLIAEITIKRGDWGGYFRELEYDGGAEAMKRAADMRALRVGPDYEGVPMLHRILERSKAVIAHSHYVAGVVRARGFEGPIGVIPHGAWMPDADRMHWREQLGLGPEEPLIGIFGYLKPYKRIGEALRAFRRLLRIRGDAKMLLVGEPHPELGLEAMIAGLGIAEAVRVIGFADAPAFTGYMAASDIVLNLRYPTVGESSGTLLRAFGLGKAVIVSEVGSFAEYPDEICLKTPVDQTEEDTLFEYLNLLVTRPDLRVELGACARRWVERECSWPEVARRYAGFLAGEPQLPPPPGPAPVQVPVSYLAGWTRGEEPSRYLQQHRTRLARTLEITPAGTVEDRVLEMGAYLQITPALRTKLGYGDVRGCYYGPAGVSHTRVVESAGGERFECVIDLFDADKDPFPYPDGYFATVLCCELLEHLAADPMHMMSEVNRILRPGGWLVLTTPNIASMRALAGVLNGYHPALFPAYIRPRRAGEEPEARHAREYAPREMTYLLRDAGFELTLLDTGAFAERPEPEHHWVRHLLERYHLPAVLRGDGIYAVGRKTGPVLDRYPAWLYS